VAGVTETTVWRTDEPCPVCAAGLFLVGHGQPVQVAECRLCGWSERWDLTADTSNNGKRGDAR
jgi:ribosomal protein S27AE